MNQFEKAIDKINSFLIINNIKKQFEIEEIHNGYNLIDLHSNVILLSKTYIKKDFDDFCVSCIASLLTTKSIFLLEVQKEYNYSLGKRNKKE